ncbi:hypothetical protein M9458_051752 [Cirrhinus mrigala]|uniref:Gypsy retrotransposon integrase-like protein 1 n=1 Tax=Cirrhinus mrigala TaxID=683832 RepID=A0ABD0MUM2_CIRMR
MGRTAVERAYVFCPGELARMALHSRGAQPAHPVLQEARTSTPNKRPTVRCGRRGATAISRKIPDPPQRGGGGGGGDLSTLTRDSVLWTTSYHKVDTTLFWDKRTRKEHRTRSNIEGNLPGRPQWLERDIITFRKRSFSCIHPSNTCSRTFSLLALHEGEPIQGDSGERPHLPPGGAIAVLAQTARALNSPVRIREESAGPVQLTLRGGEVILCGMEFDLIEFTLAPSVEAFNRCRKKDLLLIAEFFNISVSRDVTKEVLKNQLYIELVNAGILPTDSQTEGVEEENKVAEMAETSAAAVPLGINPSMDPLLAVRLKELELAIKQQEHETQVVQLRAIEAQVQRDIKLKTLALDAEDLRRKPVPAPRSRPSSPLTAVPVQSSTVNFGTLTDSRVNFDVAKYIKLVPPFREAEVDAYFIAFERIAEKLGWPKDMWGLLLQCNFVGKAQEHTASVFRGSVKTAKQTFVEFARGKRTLFGKWCLASKVASFEQLQDLILLEEFKNCIPENIVVHLNEQKINSLSEAAVLADEFALTHRSVFSSTRQFRRRNFVHEQTEKVTSPVLSSEKSDKGKPMLDRTSRKRVCFYCLDPGHLISDCKAWKQKTAAEKSKSVAFAQASSMSDHSFPQLQDSGYQPFLLTGSVSLSADSPGQPVSILRDTGAAQSFILAGVLPFSPETYSGTDVLVRGIELGCVKVPLDTVYLKSDLVTGPARIGVRTELPVEGVSVILGNDLAGGKVFPCPIVVDKPVVTGQPDVAAHFPAVFPACAVTRAQSRKWDDVVDITDSFINPVSDISECTLLIKPEISSSLEKDNPDSAATFLKVGKEDLAAAQKADPSLSSCLDAAVSLGKAPGGPVTYYWDGVLMRRWQPPVNGDVLAVHQLVLPSAYRSQVLKLAHEHPLSGHLGITKTYKRILKYFFWPGLRNSVVSYCRACHDCQVSGKPNQTVPSAPLRPIPVMNEPFERLILDCVGPLPKSKSGHQYILTIMCAATRFPEAVPLRSLRANIIVREVIKLCSTFGLPRVIQTDQGSNFTSKLFAQVLKELGVSHQMSSAYHPESQGALERFHRTLKSMLQQLMSKTPLATNVLDYVSNFRERLHSACDFAKAHLVRTQSKMKSRFDRRSVKRSFQAGDQVLVLLPVPFSALHARFAGPYSVEKKLSQTDYVISTPDRRRKSRVRHINMLKSYVSKGVTEVPSNKDAEPTKPAVVVPAALCSSEDDPVVGELTPEHLQNSAVLSQLDNYLAYLPQVQKESVVQLLNKYHMLFSDVPGRTSMIVHDIDVGSCPPIKQHPYRVNPQKRELMRREVEYLLKHGLATPSQSPWSSPCLLVPKQDSTYRFCTDYRKVNSVTKPDSFPLPRMEDCVDKIGCARFITKLDLLKGYWQVPLTARASEISAFVTPDNLLKYSVMAFGMRNAPATFQRLMQRVLSDIPNCEAYLDDVVVFSHTWEEHLSSLDQVFKELSNASLTLNLKKCEFAKAVVTYLGKKVGQGQVKPVEAKIEAILEFPIPRNKRELRRFLGMVGYYRSFCRNFASVVTPLTDLLSTARKFVWSPECDSTFNAAKDLLSSAPVLSAPCFTLLFKLQVDASSSGARAVLLQEDADGVEHPVCYFSKKFTNAQQKHSTIEKETLALVLAL